MIKFIDEIEPDKYFLRHNLYKFNSLIMEKGTVINEKEKFILENWNIARIDVSKILKEEDKISTFVPFDDEIINQLDETKLDEIKSLEELEKLDFDIDIEKCESKKDLYIENSVQLEENYSYKNIKRTNYETKKFIEHVFTKVENGEDFSANIIKNLVTKKIEEFKEFSSLLFQSIFDNHEHDYVFTHSVNVMILALSLGKRIGLDNNSLAELGIASMLHDIGMAKINKDYYLNENKYTFDDYFEIFKHPIHGIDYLTLKLRSKFGGLVSLAVYQHHERLDGSGYPKGKKGKGISLYARIIGICDVFEALTTKRAYRDAVSVEQAFKFIMDNGGILFDSELVEEFYHVLRDENLLKDVEEKEFKSKARPVIITDVSRYNLWYLCHILRELQIPVYAAKSEHDLITMSLKLDPGIILVDSEISEKSGLNIIEFMKRNKKTRDIALFFSSSGEKDEVIRALKMGINGYIKKPYSFELVLNKFIPFLEKV